MNAPLKEIEQIAQLQREARRLLDAEQPAEALEVVEEALRLEAQNTETLLLKAEGLERQGRSDDAAKVQQVVRQLKREAWQRQVEAEARGHHELLGEAIRHEQP